MYIARYLYKYIMKEGISHDSIISGQKNYLFGQVFHR